MIFKIWDSFTKRREEAEAIQVEAQFSAAMDYIESNQTNEHSQACIAQGFVALTEKFSELAKAELPPHLHENYITFIPPRKLKKEAKHFKNQAVTNANSNDPKRILLGLTQELFGFYLLCMSWKSASLLQGDMNSILNSPGVVRVRIRDRISKFLSKFGKSIDELKDSKTHDTKMQRNSSLTQEPQSNQKPNSESKLLKEFTLSFFQIIIEADVEDGRLPFRLTATDNRTNQFAFSCCLEASPLGAFLVIILSNGTRYDFGQLAGIMSIEEFENWAIPHAINQIYADHKMTDDEVHAFGVRVVAEHLGKFGFHLLTIQHDIKQDPQILAMKDGKSVGIIVRTDAFPLKGTLGDMEDYEIDFLLEKAEQQDQDLYFASVGLENATANSDYERGVLVRNGSFHISFDSLEKISTLNRTSMGDPFINVSAEDELPETVIKKLAN